MNLTSGGSTTSEDDDSVVKTYVDGSVRWYKVDHHGDPLGGASFEVCRTHDLVSATGTYAVLAEADCFPITDDDATDEDKDPGELEVSGLVLGRYTVEETAAPTGYSIPDGGAGPFGFDDDMTLADPDIERAEAFVNVKLFRIIVLTCDDGTDTLVDGTVTLDLAEAETMTDADFATLGWKDADGSPLTQQDLCNMGLTTFGGASFGDLEEGTYSPSVEVPDVAPLFD
jgi:hypothetical protein